MAGAIELVVCGVPPGPLPVEVVRCLADPRFQRGARLLDVLHVTRDPSGILSVHPEWIGPGNDPSQRGAVLCQLLEGDHVAAPGDSSSISGTVEVGFDLQDVEGLAHQIPAGSSALLVVIEARWIEALLVAVRRAGGVPRSIGYLEAETMLVTGPQLAVAARAVDEAEQSEVARGRLSLELLRRGGSRGSATVAEVLAVLVADGIVADVELAAAVDALVRAGLAPDAAPRAESG